MFEELVENFVGIVAGASDTILDTTSVDARVLERGLEAFRVWSKLPDASMWYGTFWAEGVKGEENSSQGRPPAPGIPAGVPPRTVDKLTAMRFLG